jgi:membrane protease YdiL (CAAX protease family)
LTGFYEETLMHGEIICVLRPCSPVRAVLISAALFGLLHATNFVLRNPASVLAQMVGAGCSGVGLAALRLRTNILWFVIAIHMAEDLMLKLSALPAIPVKALQSPLMLVYGLFLLRGMHRVCALYVP